jgi:hypothetical protein
VPHLFDLGRHCKGAVSKAKSPDFDEVSFSCDIESGCP